MTNFISPAASIIERSRRENGHGGTIKRFPEDLGAHAVILSFKEYDYRASQRGDTIHTKPQDSIVLPLPANLQDSFDVRMNGIELGLGGKVLANGISAAGNTNANAAGRATASAAMGAGQSILDGMSNANTNDVMNFIGDWGSMGKFLMRNVMSGGIAAGVDVGTGTAVNPHMAVNFDGMNLKNHTFTWQFAPKSARESDDLRDITNSIKRAITPRYSAAPIGGALGNIASEGLLKYPMMVDIFFLGIDTAYFYKFKRCLVQNFSTDYTPTGGHSILAGGKPAFVNMNMSLVETNIHTAEDYEE